MSAEIRDMREVIRDEHLMRRPILQALQDGPLTVPEVAAVVGRPAGEVMFWMMGMRKYGYVVPLAEPTDEGYYQYRALNREET